MTTRTDKHLDKPEQICPACGGANPAAAVFCANPNCHKALGEFRYVREELLLEAAWHENLAERVVGWIGKPHFLGIHLLWFVAWVVVNTGVVMVVRRFDSFPFGLLGIILAMETIFITGFVLISENRQSAHASKQAELDYEVNVLTYRRLGDIETALQGLAARMEALEQRQSATSPRAG